MQEKITREEIIQFRVIVFRIFLGIASLLVCTCVAFISGVDNSGLSRVRLVEPRGVVHGLAASSAWVLMNVVLSTGLAIAPVRRENSFWFLSFRLGLAVWLVVAWCGGLSFITSFEFFWPSDHCVYSSCWPQPFQGMLACAPLLIACAVFAITDVFRRPIDTYLRAILPSVIYIFLTVMQFWVWDRYILQFLNGPPPSWWQ
ncbi:hypothetical protein [Devriesea agamarum]|uniref:hypothetical protein n=1 Tax=Devriesea agamarum TaxID=472569 RepID=UPI0012EDF846|nr:hypothetical protein [Devriesea agamarum]